MGRLLGAKRLSLIRHPSTPSQTLARMVRKARTDDERRESVPLSQDRACSACSGLLRRSRTAVLRPSAASGHPCSPRSSDLRWRSRSVQRHCSTLASQRRAGASGCIEQLFGPSHLGLKERVVDCGAHQQVNGAAEKLLQVLLETEIGTESIREVSYELNCQVDVATFRVKAVSQCRPEHRKPNDPVPMTQGNDRFSI